MLARNVNILQLANACRRCARARTCSRPYVHSVCPYDMYIALEFYIHRFYRWSDKSGWDHFGACDYGSPPGYYQWQPLSLAFNMMLRLEGLALRRYSHIVRLRLDGQFFFPVPEFRQWMNAFSTDTAYLRPSTPLCISEVFVILGREHAAKFSSLLTHFSASGGIDMSLLRHESGWKNKLHEDELQCEKTFRRKSMQAV